MRASITATVTARGLGLPLGTASPICVVGCCSSGTVDAVNEYVNPDSLVSTHGHGPAVELAAFLFAITGGPILFCRATTATPGSAGSVTRTGTGLDADAWAMAVSGTPRDAYQVRVKVTRYGATLAALTAAVRWSVDGGQTYGPEVPVPSSGAITLGDTGLTITFNDGSATDEAFADDVYSFDCTAPAWDTTGLASALAAVEASALVFDGVIVAGEVTGATVTTVKDSHDRLVAASRLKWFLCNSRDQNSGESNATYASVLVGASPGFASFTANFCAVSFGYFWMDSQTSIGGIWRRPLSWPLAAELSMTPPHEHPGKGARALPGIRTNGLIHDINASAFQVLDTRRFIGAQTLQGVDGYVATDRTAAADGTDFTSIMRVRVMVYAARIAMQRMTQEVNVERLINTNGTIDAAEADAIDAAVTSFMVNEIANPRANRRYCSDVAVQVSRSADLSSTSTLPFKLRIRPLGYSTAITLDLGYALNVRN